MLVYRARYGVSIHVPARGTTLFFQPSCFLLSFQSTFPRGERQRCTIIISLFISLFQSTFPRGERPGYLFIISPLYMFQSTFPRGERQFSYMGMFISQLFQSTFPRGERQCPDFPLRSNKGFNPRSREGNDFIVERYSCYFHVSIHVPARGTTTNIK